MANRGPLNPYLVGPPVTGEQGFYGRHNLVENVVTALTSMQQNAIVLHGQRRIGKSSLLHRLLRDSRLQETYLPILFDLQLLETLPPERKLLSLAEEIGHRLDPDMLATDDIDLKGDYKRFQRRFLPEVYKRLGQKRLLLLFDELDVIVPSGPLSLISPANTTPSDSLLDYMRILIAQEFEHLSFVFVVGQRIDLLGEGYQRLFKGARAQPVGRLSEEDTRLLLTDLGQQAQMTYAEETLADIWALTNGHPYLTQLLGAEIFNHLQQQNRQQAMPDDLAACLNRAMEHGQAALDWFWNGFEPEQQWVLSAIAAQTSLTKSINDAEIEAILNQYLLPITEVTRNQACRQLLQGDFLNETAPQQYQFAVEFIRRWIVKHHPISEAKRRIEEINPEAFHYFQMGQRSFLSGDTNNAIIAYRLAVDKNPFFFEPQLGLASALRAQRDIQTALIEYEKAYNLDADRTRQEFIDARLDYIRQLQIEGAHDKVIEQAWLVLALDANHIGVRKLISDHYLAHIKAHLDRGDLAEAINTVAKLRRPIPIIEDAGVTDNIRECWLAYSQRLIQQAPPQWEGAQQALDSLVTLDLENEQIKAAYNHLILEKAAAFLKRNQIAQALTALSNELKSPRPDDAVKQMLLDHSQRQMEREQWPQANKVLATLCDLIDDPDCQDAQQGLYHRWGGRLLQEGSFKEAIEIYRRGIPKLFRTKIAQAYLDQGKWQLAQPERSDIDLPQAEVSFQQALKEQSAKTNQAQARQALLEFFNTCREKQSWHQADKALQSLKNLNLVDDQDQELQASLLLDWAAYLLASGTLAGLEAAFQQLARLGPHKARSKEALRPYLQQKANVGGWAAGAAALKRLDNLLPKDKEATSWRANWLFGWAKALFPGDRSRKKPVQAQTLCAKALDLASNQAPLLDFSAEGETIIEKQAAGLKAAICGLSAQISLHQAQTCLDQNNLSSAQAYFEHALALPLRPARLEKQIETMLKTFSYQQKLKERWSLAENALKVGHALGVADSETSEELREFPARRARQLFKFDKPEDAFGILKREKTDLGDEDRDTIKGMVYHFSRLYAGRNRWQAARQILQWLQEWLPEVDDELIQLRNRLNREWVLSIQHKRAQQPPATAEIERLKEEVQAAEAGYQDTQTLKLATPDIEGWAKILLEAYLTLGQAYLAHNKLSEAMPVYETALGINAQHAYAEEQINARLLNYSDLMLQQRDWGRATQALHALRRFNLPSPDGRMRPDPRVDGALQRTILSKIRARLERHEVDRTFNELETLPRPRPLGEIKEIIYGYSQRSQTPEHWPSAINALTKLDYFLLHDNPQVRDQEALELLIDSLEGWGQHLANNTQTSDEQLAEAAGFFFEGLSYARELGESDQQMSRANDLATHYIQTALELAQINLKGDLTNTSSVYTVEQAFEWFERILLLREHQGRHEEQVKSALHAHVEELTKAGQWDRAHSILNNLGPLPFRHLIMQNHTVFAKWHLESAFDEVDTCLAEQNLEAAFNRLDWLVNVYKIPKKIWNEYEGSLKVIVKAHYQTWLHQKTWPLAPQALTQLAQFIPNDDEITAWHIDALCQWGAAMHQENNFAEAISTYQEALVMASQREVVAVADIEAPLLEAQLAHARDYLTQDNLPGAIECYRHVLNKPAEHLERGQAIRQALKDYRDKALQSPPDWDKAQNALNILHDLNLLNDQVLVWQQEVILQKMAADLEKRNVDGAFAGLSSLEELDYPLPMDDIKQVFFEYAQRWTEGDGWSLAISTLERLGQTFENEATLRGWISQMLTKLGDILEKQGNMAGATIAFRTAVKFS